MRLRSGKSLPKMMRPSMDNLISHNNVQNIVKQPVGLTVEEAVVSTSVRTTAHVVSSMLVSPIPS